MGFTFKPLWVAPLLLQSIPVHNASYWRCLRLPLRQQVVLPALVLDLWNGYYQIAMVEEDKEKTAFIFPLRLYQFERMPQRITGERERITCIFCRSLFILTISLFLGRLLRNISSVLWKFLMDLRRLTSKFQLTNVNFVSPESTT